MCFSSKTLSDQLTANSSALTELNLKKKNKTKQNKTNKQKTKTKTKTNQKICFQGSQKLCFFFLKVVKKYVFEVANSCAWVSRLVVVMECGYVNEVCM